VLGQQHEHVPRVRVRVEVPVDGDLLEVRARQLVGERREVVLQAGERRDAADLHAAHALGRQHPLGAVRLHDARHEHARELGQGAPERRRVARLDAVVQLVRERALELLHHADHVDPHPGRRVRGEEARELVEELHVVGELRADVRPLHLHDDRAPAAELRRVHLPEARAAERLVVERGEQLPDAPAELRLDRRLDLGEPDRRHVVLQLLQLADVGRGQQVRARRQHLPELHVGRPELHEPLAEGLRPLGARAVAALAVAALAVAALAARADRLRPVARRVVDGDPVQPLLPGEVGEPVTREQADRRRETREVAGREDHRRRTRQ
jgi:hypothetical protein